MKHKLLAGLAYLAMGACATAAPPPEAPMAAAPAAQAPASAWKAFVQKTIDDWMIQDPAFAVYQGAHQFDGRLPDWSEAGLAKRAAFLHSVIDRANAFTGLSDADRFERDYLVQVAKGSLFWIEDADQPHTNPTWYINGGLDPNVYVSRNYADKATRMKAMIGFFKAVPTAAKNIRANLKPKMPASFIKLGVAGFGGFAEYYRGDARAAFADVQDPALQAEFKATSEAAANAMQQLADWLAAATPTQDFALGAERFSRMLAATEAVDAPLDELEAVGQADLKRNQEALKKACAAYAPGKDIQGCFDKMRADKPEGGPVTAARKQIPDLTAFVRAHDLVTIPGTEQALVEESPPYNRQNSAYIDPPGPFEKGIPSIYYISPPDPSWPMQKQQDYIPGKNDLLFTSVHEVMPGHFLQFLHSNRSPSWVGRLWVGYAFAEGWAHYAEEMMWDAGLGDGDPGVHVGQLSNALLRNCRYLSAIGLHARGMTQEQSKRMFMDECYQDEGTAEQQAARGTYDPAYLNYTLGKLMIRKLRDDWTASRGGRGAWKQFHDTFLSYGGPPIPLVRQTMMHEDAPHAVF
ncbi:DUF885 domain-containing protein [Novosphingobium pentaromativorans]|uniref:DUF885 domain-containing protein n=1 Tax=Novosphingobium pentaromativorans US6-1 TaxID=1088721 RepID=G6EE00_9SPHN|nr:DUF885 domain-containing protein [Novosphingobium pentaromativorans]AIT79587.1 hypothetical protein JI59_07210 [Novosphingobium pentaromativorans US6-1]EHJ60441.1 hypothetical protein NSU_2571 [Novosphingobium pentaromativorans US6-1]